MFKAIRHGASKQSVLVVGAFAGQSRPPARMSHEATVALRTAAGTRGFRGDAGETLDVESAIVTGLGRREELRPESFRVIGAKLIKALDRMRVDAAQLDFTAALGASAVAPHAAGRALGEGIALANWRFDTLDGAATNRSPALPPLVIGASGRAFDDGLALGLRLGVSVNYARRLAATPPNICTPAYVAAEAKRLARTSGLRCSVIDFAEAKRLGMGGLVSVGQASAIKPCLVVLEHRPKRAKAKTTLALVGKTITYDTGGYSLKVNNGMKGMKYDKCGGMAVLGAMHAIAASDLPVNVVALLPAAENMVGGDAYRPDDIIHFSNGVSCEVTNTDAEGRLVLADALAYACQRFKPTAIVDVATLTGGVVVALGPWCAGLFCNDDSLRAHINDAADRSGERVWHLPLWNEHREFMRSTHADIINSNPKRVAHPIQGAAFLSYFVEPTIPWAHIDIAGTSDVESASDLYVTGPTGYGVRLLWDLAAGFAGRR